MFGITAEFLPEINSPSQLADNHKICTFKYFRLQRGSILQAVEYNCRTQVGEQAQRFANAQKSCLRAKLLRIRIPFRPTNSTEQYRICRFTNF
ncbi:hypothetical protein D3C71_1766270 [compost metagenome]